MLIMVLNDGETFTDLEGCQIVRVPDEWDIDDIEIALHDLGRGHEPADIKVVSHFSLHGKANTCSIPSNDLPDS